MKIIKSKIREFLPKELLVELNDICYDVTIPDNNTKIDLMVSSLDKYDVDYTELGSGTNRHAILIDGYVFKIAMDRFGVKDNWAEFAIAKELQPYVTKTYECNGLIVVAEYVTVVSKDEFISKKDKIRQILSYLAQGYLMGDVGSISKNFMNWGYRDDGQLVILDFAYIYKIKGEEMVCGGVNANGEICDEFLEYDENFYKLTCPRCRKTYTFYDIRKKIDPEYEMKEVEMSKQLAYQTTEPVLIINGSEPTNTVEIKPEDIYGKDEEKMFDKDNEYENKITDEELESMYEHALDEFPSISVCDNTEEDDNDVETETVHFDMDEVLETAEEYLEDIIDDEETVVESSDPEYQSMKQSTIGSTDEDDEYYADPEDDEYCTNKYDEIMEQANESYEEEIDDRPSTISETVTSGISDELNEEYAELEDDPECVVKPIENRPPWVRDSACQGNSSVTSVEETEEIEEVVDEAYAEAIAEIESIEDEEHAIDEKVTPVIDYEEETEADTVESVSVEHTETTTTTTTNTSGEQTVVKEERTSFVEFIEPTQPDNIDEMRQSLKQLTDDDYDDMYEDMIEDQQKHKYSQKKGAREWQ